MKLVRALARLRRPALAGTRIVAHIFTTSYAAVDRELPELIAQHKPDALLMFGLHGRAKAIRIETRARNALALLPDASGQALRRSVIAAHAPPARRMPMPAQRLLTAARTTRLPAVLSRDAGRYLCNYLCWRSAESGVRLAAFIHVPPVQRYSKPSGPRPAFFSIRPRESGGPDKKALDSRLRGNDQSLRRFSVSDLLRAGEELLVALHAAVNRA